jgi:predicted glycoside hydrolase/deacetylase ChbG (UPF0249 family)
MFRWSSRLICARSLRKYCRKPLGHWLHWFEMNHLLPIRLIVRADDAGSSLSANEAIEQCVEFGLVRNVSIMVPGPNFEDAARRFAGREDLCFGLHITLNSELTSPKWGPVSPRETVSSLLDGNGYFLATPTMTMQSSFVVEEAMREIEAQLRAARQVGLKLTYVDEHMVVSRIGIRQQIAELCRRENLIDVHGLARLPLGTSLDMANAELQRANSGDYVWVTHPGFMTPDTLKLHPEGRPNDGSFARTRDAERRLLTDPNLRALFETHGVRSCGYNEL